MTLVNQKEKQRIKGVFDGLAADRTWESLYSGEISYRSYNFVSRARAVQELLRSFTAGHVLDLGCGTGDFLPYFAQRNSHYIGVDVSEEMIARAKINHSDLLKTVQARFLVGDCDNLSFKDGSFDIVIAVGLIEYFSDISEVLSEIKRITKRGGVVVISVPNKHCLNTLLVDIFAPLRRLLLPVYKRITGARLSRMDRVHHYRYIPDEFDAIMKNVSFSKIGYRYTNFHFIIYPFEVFLPSLYIKFSEIASKYQNGRRIRHFASNYIGLYEREHLAEASVWERRGVPNHLSKHSSTSPVRAHSVADLANTGRIVLTISPLLIF